MDNLVTILIAVISSGVLNTILTFALTARNEKKNKDNSMKSALRLIVKDRLRFLCVHYIQQKWIYEDELDDIVDMHESYKQLGGNGFLNALMDQVKRLEVRGVGVK